MTEWGVVGVVIALAGFIVTIGKPMISLTKSITELTVAVRELKEDQREQKKTANTVHEKLWDKANANAAKIAEHETRIGVLEGK